MDKGAMWIANNAVQTQITHTKWHSLPKKSDVGG